MKAGATGSQWKFVFNITAGYTAPGTGHRTKLKGTVNITPLGPPFDAYTCADDSNSIQNLTFHSPPGGSAIIKKE